MNSIRGKTSAFIVITCAASLFFSFGAHAARKNDPRIPSPGELRLLPSYCPHTQIISKHYGRQQSATKHDAATKQFVDMYGADFWHLHHYCFGLVAALRAGNQAKPSDRQAQLIESISQYDYVIGNVRQGSLILPELHLQKGISLIKLKRGEEAVHQLKRAIQLNPGFAQPYIELGNYYADSGKKALALQTLEEGLSISPDTASLKQRYADLGGTKTFAKSETPQQDTAPNQHAPQPEQASQKEAPRTDEQIGSPTNPYCRFCP